MSEHLRRSASEYFPVTCPQSRAWPHPKTARRKFVPVVLITVIEHTRPVRSGLFEQHSYGNHVGDVIARVGQIRWTVAFAQPMFCCAIGSPSLSHREQFL